MDNSVYVLEFRLKEIVFDSRGVATDSMTLCDVAGEYSSGKAMKVISAIDEIEKRRKNEQ